MSKLSNELQHEQGIPKAISKDLDYYLSLPYTKTVQLYADETATYYISRCLELQGCHSDGDTEAEALANLNEAMALWIETNLEAGDYIPEPKQFSGKLLLRIPKSLHQQLSVNAEHENVSLNQYVLSKLSV